MTYSVELISIEKKGELVGRYSAQVLHEVKSDIYGCCIKLLTGQRTVKDRWVVACCWLYPWRREGG